MPTSVPEKRTISVAVPRPLHDVYHYAVPPELPVPQPGARVRVPFGHGQTVGFCISDDTRSTHPKLKAIAELIDPARPLVAGDLLQLAQWMARYYHHPLGEVLSTMIPGAARKGAPDEIAEEDFWQVCGDPFDNARAPAQSNLWAYIEAHPGCSGADLVAAGHKRQSLRELARKGFVERVTALAEAPDPAPHVANAEQQAAIDAVMERRDAYATFVLQGVTGSGKTEVYLQCIEQILSQGKQALVLVPEIALTPQTISRFRKRLPGVASLHSAMTDHERFQTWLKCRAGEVNVLIGTRSAVFTPFADLGLIVVDEEHDSSYKQQDGLRYSARDIAAKRASDLSIPLLLGSATPSLETLYNVRLGRYQTLALNQRATGASMPAYHLLDMRGQQHEDGISPPLQHVIKRHLDAGNQVLVFLNRRGYSPTLLCSACGWQAQCSDCDARLTLHQKPEQLVCHYCALRFPIPQTCEACGKAALLPVGLGTQRTENGLSRLFPDVPIYRIDRDAVRTTRQLEERFALINRGDPCIMVGTQMLAKGHHFPRVTLVAVINADGGFASADFRAAERTAQLIVQVAGRAGRAERPGEVFIQTYQPDNPQLKMLVEAGYPAFASQELEGRILAGMPPAQPMAIIRADALQANQALDFLRMCKTKLNTRMVWGPVAAPTARIANRVRYQLMVLGRDRAELHASLRALAVQAPANLRWSIDVDPYDTL